MLSALILLSATAVKTLSPSILHTPTPIGDPATWISPDDYPKNALRQSIEGRTGFVLDVGEDGAVTNCDVTKSSGDDGLDAATCALLTNRAHFKPAVDAKGRPVPSIYRSAVAWQIPRGEPLPLENQDVTFAFDVDQTGRPTHCVATGLKAQDKPTVLCRAIEAGGLFVPAASRNGHPVVKHVVTRMIVSVTDAAPAAL